MEKTKSRTLIRRREFVNAADNMPVQQKPAHGIDAYSIKGLSFTYPNREGAALKDINVTIKQGEFVTLCGSSGSGKTTLLRHLKLGTTPHGDRTGEILFENEKLSELSQRDAASKIGFVLQSPENQIVTDKVWHELAFGLESLGVKNEEIRLRVAEMASFFGIQTWFHKPVTELSGGQKQLLALASIMALQPSALILDEPTSQLDPIAAGEFLTTVGKINRELGVTVILTEHRLEEAFPLSSRAIVMDKGRIIADGKPRDVGMQLSNQDHGMFLAMPTPMRVWAAAQQNLKGERSSCQVSDNMLAGTAQRSTSQELCPITVREGANWLSLVVAAGIPDFPSLQCPEDTKADKKTAALSGLEPAVKLDGVWFKYEKDMPDVVKGLNFEANYGEVTAILGGNGTGKSTTLSLIAGLNKPYRGKVNSDAQIYTLPQNPQTIFVEKTVREDLLEILSERKLSKAEKESRLASMVKLCRLESLLESHPYDLSGGEQQRAALAKVLLLQPKIILLDEPTKGLDAEFKQVFAAILKKLTDAGAAVIMASHDVEFCAEFADRCALFFDGNVVTENKPRAFFSGNSFYTTSANRMARALLPDAVTAYDLVLAVGGEADWKIPSEEVRLWDDSTRYVFNDDDDNGLPPPPKAPKLSKARTFAAAVFGLVTFAAIAVAAMYFEGFNTFISGGNAAVAAAAEGAIRYVGIMLVLSAGAIGLTLALTYRREAKPDKKAVPLSGKKLSKRTIAAAVLVLLSIPLTIYVGSQFFGDRRYYFISLLIILQTMLPFAMVFESRKPQARELVVIAVLCAIAVAGRAAFFMLPQFKPVIALVIIAGVAFGGESGFLVGAMTGFVSNFFFGQGPWTPYQMFAFGIIGLLAGILFQKGILRRSAGSLAVFGALATFIIYGGILNPASVIIFQGTPTTPMIITAYLQGIPMDLVHSIATVTFILIIAKPMLEKLDRIKAKYGLVQ